MNYTRVKTILERLDCRTKFVNFEIAALFHSLHRRVKSAAISKQTNFFRQSRRSYIILSLGYSNYVISSLIITVDFVAIGGPHCEIFSLNSSNDDG